MSYTAAQEKIAQAQAEGWTELDLAGLDLETLPPELWALEQLEILVLGKWENEQVGNKLSSLPEAIVLLSNLRSLLHPYTDRSLHLFPYPNPIALRSIQQ
jgi:Leucine-rich repeat (LRR) protein